MPLSCLFHALFMPSFSEHERRNRNGAAQLIRKRKGRAFINKYVWEGFILISLFIYLLLNHRSINIIIVIIITIVIIVIVIETNIENKHK